ncbi:MAG: hypothetical protein Q7R50_04440 [Dehalococcoidales bacterium]|nr:hypothetical protein [Dehalococcoidales bacterium]
MNAGDKKCCSFLDEEDVMELERIVTDADEKEALRFLKICVYDRIAQAQKGRLKSHLDSASPVEGFIQHNK